MDEPRSDVAPLLLLFGAAGTAGYFLWYKPEQERKAALQRAALTYQAQHGGSYGDALASVGTMVCQGAGMKYGIPPHMSAGICNQLGPLASDLVKQLPGIVGATGKTVINVATGAVGGAYKGGRTVVTDVYKGTRTVIQDVVSVPVNVVKSVGKAFASIF